MKRIKLLTMLLAMAAPIYMFAGKTLVVEMENGSVRQYLLSDKPVLTIGQNTLVIRTSTVTASLVRSEVKKAYFTDTETGIQGKVADRVSFEQTADGNLVISQIEEQVPVKVYNVAGKQFGQAVTRQGQTVTVQLSACPRGVYIIKIGNKQTLKIIRK